MTLSLDVLVSGMHRTGTSAVGALLQAAGLHAGPLDQQVPAKPENPLGFAELLPIVDFNEQLLKHAGWTWDAPPATPSEVGAAPEVLVERGRSLIAELLPTSPWYLKDPRFSLVLPTWRRILLDRFVVVVCVRPASEVAWSLAVRNGVSISLGLALWAAYYRHLTAAIEGLPAIAVSYAALTERPTDTAAELLRELSVAGVRLDATSVPIHAVIDPSLRRATAPPQKGAPVLGDDIAQVVEQLSAGSVKRFDRFGVSLPSPTQWERDVLDHQKRLRLSEADRAGLTTDLQRATVEQQAAVAERDRLHQDSHAMTTRVDQLTGEYDVLKTDHRRLSGDHAAVSAERDRLVVERDRLVVERDRLVVERDRLVVERDRLAAERDRLAAERDRLRRDRRAMTTRVDQLAGEYDVLRTDHQRLSDDHVAASEERDRLAAERDRLRRDSDAMTADIEAMSTELALMRSSRSWRMTAPMRAAGRQARALPNALRNQLARASRALYHAIPLAPRRKAGLKKLAYLNLAPLFRNTPGYVAWHSERGNGEQRVVPAAAVSLYGEPEAPVLDGRVEWVAYEPTGQRITDAIQRRDRTDGLRPRRLIDIGRRDPRRFAGRIRLPAPGPAPDVSVIIPAYGKLTYTLECLQAVADAATGALTIEVLVGDDASEDNTAAVLADIANLRLIRQPHNVGFLRNCNAAAQEARGRLLVFLNNDTQVQPGWLDALAAVIDGQPDVGAVGPRIVYPNGVLQEAGTRIRRDGSVEMLGLNSDPSAQRWSYERDVDYVSGACLMIRAEVFAELGGFDDALAPSYCEDLELGLRLRARGLRCVYTPHAEVIHHLSITSDSVGSDAKLDAITRNSQLIADRYQEALDRLDDVRVIAFYLPQFHVIEQNELWWGRGFTEWTKVAQARPNYVGHYQPRLPADLGYYDLSVPETMDRQWALAARYGIDAFCYYYYWFGGRRLLDAPLEGMLKREGPVLPFCLCWANENWTRRWDGLEDEVLMAQSHGPEDDVNVIRDMARYFARAEYVRVGGRPLVLVYRISLFPDFAATARRWREECARLGVGEIHLAIVESFEFAGRGVDPSLYGCDAVVEFPAHHIPEATRVTKPLLNASFAGSTADYSDVLVRKATRAHPGSRLYRTVMPGWDNTPRRQGSSFVLDGATPGAFRAWVEAAIADTKRDLQGDQRLLFVNAWNEWAEGAYLEPDQRYGHSFLEAIRLARERDRLVFPSIR